MKAEKPWTDDDKRQLAELRGARLSSSQIAEIMDRKQSAIKAAFYRFGLSETTEAVAMARELAPTNRRKKWPTGCFAGQDVDTATLNREATRIWRRPPLRASRFGVETYEGPVT
jgi:hypothetical protein